MKSKFTEMLIKKREEKNFKKFQVADIFGWCSDYYCKIEKGYILPPKSRYSDFANYLGISVEKLTKIVEESVNELRKSTMEEFENK